ncbi:RadC family protein [Anaerorhabdus sp.]|uniref:RadC family protein n=1 Tax=Anaerorhabdus sp. TaxID=1872524 RepID=UPI002FCA1574
MALVKEIPSEERPREKALKFGVKGLSNTELLALLIRTGYQGFSSLAVAEALIKKAGGLNGLSRLSKFDLIGVKGIKEVKALEIMSCIELARRMSYEEIEKKDVIKDPRKLIDWLRNEIGNELQENFLVVYLNVKNHIITYRILFKGTVDCSLVHPREIFKEALLHSSSKILLVHNHPSSDTEPSLADLEMTQQIVECGEMMGITVLDHIIVSGHNYLSFKAKGLL